MPLRHTPPEQTIPSRLRPAFRDTLKELYA